MLEGVLVKVKMVDDNTSVSLIFQLHRQGADTGMHQFKPHFERCNSCVDKKAVRFSRRTAFEEIGATGFEPATSCSQSRHSTKLSYAP